MHFKMEKILWIIALQGLALCRGFLYPRESETRELKSLDGIWQFRITNDTHQGLREGWFSEPLPKSGPTIPMPVPSSYNDITQEKNVREHIGNVWYERTFFVPNTWKQQGLRIWLHFGSAHYMTRVWINGRKVLHHEIGHLPFQREITSIIQFGAENRITVCVDNTLTATTIPQGSIEEIPTYGGKKRVQRYTFDFFNYAGIHRSVHLYTTPSIYVDDITVVTDISGSKGLVYFNMSYGGSFSSTGDVSCQINLLDKEGGSTEPNVINTYGKNGFIGKIDVPDAKLWWPYLMHPQPGYLYTFEVRIYSEQWGVQDIYRLPVGIRTIHWTNTSFLLNKRPVYLRGFGKHEDSDIRGKGVDLPLIAKDFNLLKWVGANSFRTSHYPYAEEIMDFADQQGFMVIDECPSVDTDKFSPALLQKHKDSLTELIQRDKNRPSVIMWSVANEPRTQHPEADVYFRSVVDHVKTLDTKRPVTAVLNRWYTVDQAGQHMDIISFNRYNGWYTEPGKTEIITFNVIGEATHWYNKHKKPVIMMEYGSDSMVGLHMYPEFVWSEEYQVELLSEHFRAFDYLRKKNFFIGEMIWNFADFRTDQSTVRVGGNRKGIFTRQREPKAAAFHVRNRYFKLAFELDNHDMPPDLEKYVASVPNDQNNKIEL